MSEDASAATPLQVVDPLLLSGAPIPLAHTRAPLPSSLARKSGVLAPIGPPPKSRLTAAPHSTTFDDGSRAIEVTYPVPNCLAHTKPPVGSSLSRKSSVWPLELIGPPPRFVVPL